MTAGQQVAEPFNVWAMRVSRAMEPLWLLALLLVPLAFATPSFMANGYDVPKVTLYRSLVGLMGALWIIELGLTLNPAGLNFPRLSLARAKEWLFGAHTRWVLVGACLVLASNFISTLLSSSVPISLWGSEPARDGYSLYNSLSHFILFAVVAAHLKTTAHLWRLLAALVASGVVVGFYGILQFYGLDPFGVHLGGAPITSSLGNSIFAAAFLLMVVPVTLAMALRSHAATVSPAVTIIWVAVLTVPLLAIVFTHARGPWLGLAAALVGFLVLTSTVLGWRAMVRAGALLAVSLSITLLVVIFAPPPTSPVSPLARGLSIPSEVKGALDAGDLARSDFEAGGFEQDKQRASVPSSMRSRLLLWQGAGRLALYRPWFGPDDRPSLLLLHAFGYGPEFFQYLFPLEYPLELVDPRDSFFSFAQDAHSSIIHRTVELGLFGLATELFLLGSLFAVGLWLIMGKSRIANPNLGLAMVAVLASIGGRTVEQLAGIPHLSDEALFWTLAAVAVALPRVAGKPPAAEWKAGRDANLSAPSSSGYVNLGGVASRLIIPLALALGVIIFTVIKNPYYFVAETKARAAESTLKEGNLQKAIQQIDGAIALAPDVGRFHVTRAKILDAARKTSVGAAGPPRLAKEAYLANQRAVETNPFDVYSRLHFAESAYTMAALGQLEMGEVAIEEYGLLTLMMPGHWLPHFLLGRAHMELGQLQAAIDAHGEAIRLNPQFRLSYSQRGMAYLTLGQYERALGEYDKAIHLSIDASDYGQRGVVLFHLGQLEKSIEDFDQAIRLDSKLASVYNNRGGAYHELGQIERAIDDYDEAIRLNPRFTQAYANRAAAYSQLKMAARAKKDIDRARQLGLVIEAGN